MFLCFSGRFLNLFPPGKMRLFRPIVLDKRDTNQTHCRIQLFVLFGCKSPTIPCVFRRTRTEPQDDGERKNRLNALCDRTQRMVLSELNQSLWFDLDPGCSGSTSSAFEGRNARPAQPEGRLDTCWRVGLVLVARNLPTRLTQSRPFSISLRRRSWCQRCWFH